MKKHFNVIVFTLITVCAAQFAKAGAIDAKWSMFEIGFVPPVQLFAEDSRIYGMRLSLLWTESKAVYGLDFGLGCKAKKSCGVQIAGLNYCTDLQSGLSIGAINIAVNDMYGAQIGLFSQAGIKTGDDIVQPTDHASGVQISWINLSQAIFKGLQMGVVNISDAVFNGLQIGIINFDKDPDKFMDIYLGKKQKREKPDNCVQIGVLNFNDNGILPVTLLINF